MNVKSIEKEGSKAKITVEIEKDLMDSGANKAYLKARKDIQLPGFRKGKAPRKLIESIYGAHVFYEDGLEEIFPQVYQAAVVEQELKAVGRPSLLHMDIADDGAATIVLETDLYPEVTLGQYKGLEVVLSGPAAGAAADWGGGILPDGRPGGAGEAAGPAGGVLRCGCRQAGHAHPRGRGDGRLLPGAGEHSGLHP